MTYKSMSPQMDYIKDERADQEMDCIASDQNGQWTTFHCDDKFYSLCKKKLSTLMNTFRKTALTYVVINKFKLSKLKGLERVK